MSAARESSQQLSTALGAATPGRPSSRPAKPWRGVYFDGPEPDLDPEGEEIPVWFVYVGDDDGNPTEEVQKCFSYEFGWNLARSMATDRRLELIKEASHA